MNPIANSSILIWEFKTGFYNVPQQSLSRFASRCRGDFITAENQTDDILPQADGVDFDPKQTNLKFRPLPMLQFSAERVGYQRYSHTWNYAIATEDLARINPSFRMSLPGMARASWERFKDRILAGKSDGSRVTFDNLNLTSSTTNQLPVANRYIITDKTKSTVEMLPIDLDALIEWAGVMYGRELYDPLTGTREVPCLTTSHAQVISMLKINQIQSRDYNQIIPLVRGDVSGFCGFEFIKTQAVGTLATDRLSVKPSTREVAASPGSGFLSVAEETDKVLLSFPGKAFSMGMYPQAGYMHVWQNPNRSGAWETFFKDTISWKRLQNEYVLMAYAKKAGSPTDAPIRKASTKGANYYDNSDGGSVWDYSTAA